MRKQEKTVIVVAGIDLISIVTKFFLASITGSLALLADAWHSMTDLVTSLMVLTALILDRREKTGSRQPTANSQQPTAGDASLHDTKPGVSTHPRIIRRSCWEPRVCAMIGIALIAVAAGVFKKVYTGTGIEGIRQPVIAALVVLFLILLSYIRFKFEDTVGKQTDSPALIADAYHSRADIYVLILVLVSFVGELIQIRIDRWVAGFIALMIFTLGIKTIIRSLTMMFRLSQRTEPGERTVEDAVILLTMGGFTSGKNRVEHWISRRLHLEDPAMRKRVIRYSVRIGAAVLILVWLSTGLYMVGPSEQAIVEHFGRAVNLDALAGPGLHLDWPYPVSTVRRVDTHTVRWMRLGYQTRERGDLILWTNAHYIKEYSVLAGDSAIIDLAANLHFRVNQPADFLYANRAPVDSLNMLANQVIREITGTRDLFSLLTSERDVLENYAQDTIQILADEMNLGIEVVQLCLLDMHPPIEVAPAYEDVVSAQEDLETFVEQARGYERELLPGAEAEAFATTTVAQAYSRDVILRSEGRAQAFAARNKAFRTHEAVNRYRYRLEALETWMQGRRLWLVDPDASEKPLDLFINPGGNVDTTTMMMQPGTGGEEF